VADTEQRRWLAFEESSEYIAASAFRFLDKETPDDLLIGVFDTIHEGRSVDLGDLRRQRKLTL
jgi:site-specific DNA-methyltransferase (cytosine-N4-specific)